MFELTIVEMLTILVISGVTAFFYLFTSWDAAHTASIEDDVKEEMEAKAEGIDAYAAWKAVKGKVLEWKEKGMASVVWIEVIAMTILGAVSTLIVMDQVRFFADLEILGTALGAALGGFGLAFVWEWMTKEFVENYLDGVKLKIFNGLGNIECAIAKIKETLKK